MDIKRPRPSAAKVVALLKAHQINHVRLYYADVKLLRALSLTGIQVVVGVTNDEVKYFANYPSKAARWVKEVVVELSPATNITAIAVGNEFLTMLPKNESRFLVPAMNNLHKALVAAKLSRKVKISAPQTTEVMVGTFPPSTAKFSRESTLRRLLQFLKNTDSFYMVNAYPYRQYVDSGGVFPIEYALFQPGQKIVDSNTDFQYENMLDSLIDATYFAMSALDFRHIPVVVSETGWPWAGDNETEPQATVKNAETFNNNLIQRVLNGSGPPSRREIPMNVYIYEMYNEDDMPGPVSERSWGVFFSDGSPVYPLNFTTGSSEKVRVNSSFPGFCVAKAEAKDQDLQGGIDWACGPGETNCSAILSPRDPCYGDSVKNRASFAFNEYFQRMRFCGGNCDFSGTANLTDIDPSYGSCRFTQILNSTRPACPSTSPPSGPASEIGKASRIRTSFGRVATTLVALVFLELWTSRY
ncbi:unnamed protein product [Cuscuta campestris]|nr:unnamed protein product [Cuscuta campestris]